MKADVLVDVIIRPTLSYLELGSRNAEQLILDTAKQESACGHYLRQIGYDITSSGGAFGIYQCELKTYYDILDNYLKYRPELATKVHNLKIHSISDAENLMYNLPYATAICRIHYLRVKEKLPDSRDVTERARYWKKYYNTPKGKGIEQEFIDNYKRYLIDE